LYFFYFNLEFKKQHFSCWSELVKLEWVNFSLGKQPFLSNVASILR